MRRLQNPFDDTAAQSPRKAFQGERQLHGMKKQPGTLLWPIMDASPERDISVLLSLGRRKRVSAGAICNEIEVS